MGILGVLVAVQSSIIDSMVERHGYGGYLCPISKLTVEKCRVYMAGVSFAHAEFYSGLSVKEYVLSFNGQGYSLDFVCF